MPSVIVFGSINLDIAVPVDRMPETGETILGGDCIVSPGGKGANQAHAARLAGADVVMIGRVGADGFAGPALECLKKAGVDLRHVGTTERATGCATIWNGPGGTSTIVVSPGANADVAAGDVDDAILAPGSILLLQQEVPLDENAALIARARARGVTTILNAAPAIVPPIEVLRAIDYLMVNEIEARRIADGLVLAEIAPDDLAKSLAQATNTIIVATFGADGLIRHDGGDALFVPAHPVDVIDTTGAGDTFIGVFGACLARGLAEREALEVANRAAALSCTRRGAQAAQPTWAEVERFRVSG